MNIIDTLKENGIYEFIMNIQDEKERNKILSGCRIEEFKKGDFFIFLPEGETLAMAFLSGGVKMTVYVDEIADYTVSWNIDMWFGVAQALSEDIGMCEIIFKEDTKVLFFPLRDILFGNPKENIDLWIKISKMAARKALQVQRKVIERGALPTETYFLKRLSENGYCFEGVSVPEISQELNVNIRTLQRAIQLLEKQGYIKRDRSKKTICAVDNSKIDMYLEGIINK